MLLRNVCCTCFGRCLSPLKNVISQLCRRFYVSVLTAVFFTSAKKELIITPVAAKMCYTLRYMDTFEIFGIDI